MKIFALSGLLVLGMVMGLAGPAIAGSVVFGLKGGLDYSNLSWDSEESGDSDYLLGFGGGLTLSTPIQESIGIDLDILFMRKGCKHEFVSGMENGQTFEIETRLDYLIVSPLLRFSPGRGGAGIYFLGGPEAGYLLKAEQTASLGEQEDSLDNSESFKDLDFGISFGLGFQTAPSDGAGFFLESRYALGLMDINNTSEGGEVLTRGLYLLAGIRF